MTDTNLMKILHYQYFSSKIFNGENHKIKAQLIRTKEQTH